MRHTEFVSRLVTLAVTVLGVLGAAPPASAHSALEDSSPEAGATVSALDEIVLEFAEPLQADAEHEVVLSTIDDRFVDTGPVRVDGGTIRVDVGGMPETGEYLLLYTVTTGDGDGAQDGGFIFAYDGPVSAGFPWGVVGGVVLIGLGVVALAVRTRSRRPSRALA